VRPALAGAAALALSLSCGSPALAQTSATRTSAFAYDPSSGLLTQEVIEPSQSQYRLQTDYTYNAFGHKTQVTVSGVDIATRSASTTYDTRGQFVTTATNALGHSESWQHDLRFGLPTSHTGPNSLTTTWSYDSFGRKTLEVRADGTRTTWGYEFCSGVAGGTASCPSGGAYRVVTTQLGPDGVTQVGPTGTTYFDQLGRTIAEDTQGFDGSTVRVSTQYDALGRVAQKSRPHFVSGGTPKWSTYTYDALGRITLEAYPDTSSTTRAYHGLTTSVTNGLSQTTTTVKNSQGQVVSVTDAQNKTITYVYDPFGNLTQVTDPAGNVTTYGYDVRGRKITSNDPDLGAQSYTYNVLDQPTSQTNAAGQVTTISYDLLGRVTQRVEFDLAATWTYDTAPKGIGKLASASLTAGSTYTRTHIYDSLGRPSQVQVTNNGQNFTTTVGYDAASRLASITYPSGFAVSYAYNTVGYQTQLIDTATSQPLWTANARDAEGHLTQQTAGNGIITSQIFDPNTGALTSTTAGGEGAVASFAYSYDVLDRLVSRTDYNTGMTETFGYDSLNRLTSTSVNLSPTPLNKTFTYDLVGNVTFKSDVGTYSYPSPGQPRPHAVASISGGIINTTFTYDAKGNMTSGNGLSIAYATYDKPSSITRGSYSLTFLHGPEHQRIAQIRFNGGTAYNTTWYVEGPGGILSEYLSDSTGYQHTSYLMAAAGLVGMRVERWNWGGTPAGTVTRYFHKDHLGSIAVITNEAGAVVERLSYDAWGKRRHPNGADDPGGAITSQSPPGFTGHEQLDSVGLVHMNGRVYDPLLARFTSADPMTENPFSTQGWNRYAYVGNSPVNFTDPSGYCFLGCFWKPIFRAIQNLFRSVPILGSIVQIAAGVLCAGPLAPVCIGVAAAAVTGITSGKLGLALRAGFITAITAGITQYFAQLAGDLGGGVLSGTQGSPISAGSPAEWGPRMGIGLSDLAENGSGVGHYFDDDGILNVVIRPSPTRLPGIVVTTPTAAAVGAPSAWSYLSTGLHWGFTAGSFLPSVLGSAFSFLDAGLYSLEGNWTSAGTALAAAGFGMYSNAGAAKIALTASREALSRSAAFRLSKELAGIPRSAQPVKTGTERLHDQVGNVRSRVYEYVRGDGSTVTIREHSLGHGKGNIGPHFNVEVSTITLIDGVSATPIDGRR
jgi:RHS repeat-associated protein